MFLFDFVVVVDVLFLLLLLLLLLFLGCFFFWWGSFCRFFWWICFVVICFEKTRSKSFFLIDPFKESIQYTAGFCFVALFIC